MAGAKPSSDQGAVENPDALIKQKGLVSIGQAAKILGVSIDTIRRWDKNGTLTSTRPDGKNRYFSVEELEEVKFSQPLSISEVSEQLGMSPSTLRRLEQRGLIKPNRDENGDRTYDKKSLKAFLRSDYFLRQKEVEEEILKPLNGGNSEESKSNNKQSTTVSHDPTTHAIVGEHHVSIADLRRFKKRFLSALGLILAAFAILITIITLLFFLFPESTAKSLGYHKLDVKNKKFVFQTPSSLWARQLKPFSQTSLKIVEAVNPDLRKRIAPTGVIQDVNDVFKPDSEGNVASVYTFTVPDTSYLKIPDQGLIANLNSDFVRGKTPGTNPGDLAILPLGTDQIKNGSITREKLAPGINLGGGTTVVNATSTNSTPVPVTLTGSGGGGSGDITEVVAGTGLQGGGTSGSVTLNIGAGNGIFADADSISVDVSTSGITTTTASNSGLELSGDGLRLIGGCNNGEVLKWDSTNAQWACGVDGGGGSQNTFSTINTSLGTAPVADSANDSLSLVGGNGINVVGDATTDTISFDLQVTSAGGTGATASNSGLQVTPSGLTLLKGCSNNQILKWDDTAEQWVCAVDQGSAASTFTVRGDSGTDQSITAGDTLKLLGGNGIASTSSSPDTITFSIDAGDGILLGADSVGLNINTSGTTGTVASNSGLEASPNGLRLLGGCSDGQVLKWDGFTQRWACQNDAAGSAGAVTLQDVYDSGNSINTTNNRDINFVLSDTTNDANFSVRIAPGSTGSAVISRVDGNDSAFPSQLLLLQNQDATGQVPNALLISSAAGTIGTAINVSDANIVDALNVGDNNIIGGQATIDFANFDVSSAGTVTIAANQSYTSLGALTVSSGAGGDLTLSAASGTLKVDAGTTTIDANGVTNLILGANSTIAPSAAGTLTLGNANTTQMSVVTSGTGDSALVLPNGSVGNAELVNSSLTINAGLGMTGGGGAALGASTTLNIGAGAGVTANADDISINLDTVASDGSLTSSVSGLEFANNGVSLIRGCSNAQLLKWNDTLFQWECADDAGAGSISLQQAYNGGNQIITSDARDMNIVLADTATDSNFKVDIQPGSTGTFSINRLAGAGSSPAQLLLLQQLDSNNGMVDGIKFNVATGGLLFTAVDASDPDIVNALDAGSNNIRIAAGTIGSNAGTTIDFSSFDLNANGQITFNSATPGQQILINAPAQDFQAFVVDAATNDSTQTAGMIQLNTDTATDNAIGGVALNLNVRNAASNLTVYGNKTNLVVDTDAAHAHTVYGDYISLTNNDADSSVYGTAIVAANGGTQSVAAGLLIENLQAGAVNMTDGVLVRATTNNTIVNAFDASDPEITNALSVGDNSIVGGLAVVDFTNFDVASTGTVTIGANQSYTGSGALTVSSGGAGSLTLNSASNTINLHSSDTTLLATGVTNFTVAPNFTLQPNTTGSLTFGNTSTSNILLTTSATGSIQLKSGTGNISVDANTAGSGSVVFADTDVFEIGGFTGGYITNGTARYNSISSNGGIPNARDGFGNLIVDSDNDLYIEGSLEVDGAVSLSGFNCNDCLNYDAFSDSLHVDADTTTSLSAYNLIYNMDSTGNFVIQDNGTPIATFANDGSISISPNAGGDFYVGTASNPLDQDSNFQLNSNVSTDVTLNTAQLTLNPTAGANTGTLQGFVVSQANSATAGAYDSLMKLENLKTSITGTANLLFLENNAAGSTIANGVNILSTSGTISTGIKVSSAGGTIGTGIDLSGANSTVDLTLDNGLTIAQTADNLLQFTENGRTYQQDYAVEAGAITTSSASELAFISTAGTADGIELTSTGGGISLNTSGATDGEDILLDSSASTQLIGRQTGVNDAIRLTATAADSGILIDASTTAKTVDAVTLNTAVNSANVDGIALNLTVGTALSAGEVANGVNINASGLAGDSATSNINGLFITGDTTTGATMTGLALGGSFDYGIDLQGATSSFDIRLDDGATIAQLVDNEIEFTENARTFRLDYGQVANRIRQETSNELELESTADGANAMGLTATAGGIYIQATGASAGEDINVTATGSSVNLTSTEAVTDAIVLNSSNATTAGIRFNAGDQLGAVLADGNDIELRAEDDTIFNLTGNGNVVVNATQNANTTTNGVIDVDVSTQTNNNSGFNLNYQVTNDGAVTAKTTTAAVIAVGQQDVAGQTTRGLLIQQSAVTASGAGNGVDALLVLDNADTDADGAGADTAATLQDALRITGSGTGAITTGLNFATTNIQTDISFQNGETLDNNTNGSFVFTGVGGTNNATLTLDLDGAVNAVPTLSGSNNHIAVNGNLSIGVDGTTAQSISVNSAIDPFVMNGNDLYVADDAGINGDLYIDGALYVDGVGSLFGDITIQNLDPRLTFDDTTPQDDYYLEADNNQFYLINSTDGRTEFTFDGTGGFSFGDNTATKTLNFGGNAASSADTIKIATNGTLADTINIGNQGGATAVTIDAGTSGVSLDATGSSNFTVNGSGQNLTLQAIGGGTQQLVASSAGTGANALRLLASAGGIDVDANNSTIDITNTTDSAGDDFTLAVAGNTDSSLILQSSGTGSDAIRFNPTNANSSIFFDGGTTDRTANLIAIDFDNNSSNASGIYLDLGVGTALSAGETTNGLSVNLVGQATDSATSAINGLLLTGDTTSGGVVTGLKLAGSFDTGLDLSGANSTTDLILDDGLTIAQTADENLTIVEGGQTLTTTFASATSTITTASASQLNLQSSSTTANAFIMEATGAGGSLQLKAGTGEPTALTDGNDIELLTTDDILLTPGDDISARFTAGDRQFVLDAATNANTSTAGVVDLNVATVTSGNIGLNVDYTVSSGATGSQYAAKINLNQQDNDALLQGLTITNNNDANFGITQCLVCLDNQDTTAASVVAAIRLSGTSTDNITTGIDFNGATGVVTDFRLQNGATIDNNTNGTLLLSTGDAAGQVQTTHNLVIGNGSGNDYLGFTAEGSDPAACVAGQYSVWANSALGKLRKCQNGVVSDLDTGGTWSSLTAPSTNLSLNHAENTTNFTWDTATTANKDYFTFNLVNDVASGAQNLVTIKTDSTSTQATEALLVLSNGSTNAGATVTDGLRITSAGSTITNGINFASTAITFDLSLQNGATIDNDTNNQVKIDPGTNGTVLLTDATALNASLATFNLVSTSTTVNVGGGATSVTLGAGTSTTTVNDGLVVTGNTNLNGNTVTFGNASTDTVSVNSNTWTYNNDTNFVLSGGVNGLSLDGTTFSVDALNHRVGIGTATPTHALNVSAASGNGINVSGGGVYYHNGTAGASLTASCTALQTTQTLVTTGGLVTASACSGGLSDQRAKQDIVAIGSSLERINQLRGVNYYWDPTVYKQVTGQDAPDGIQFGFIAQEVQKVFPEAVFSVGYEDYIGVNYAAFTPILLQAVNELDAQVNTNAALASGGLQSLTDRVNDLDSRVATLENNAQVQGTSTTSSSTPTDLTYLHFDTAGNGTFDESIKTKDVVANQVVGTDLGERYYTTDDSIETGSVVAVDGSLLRGAKKTTGAYDGTALGIVTTAPGLLAGSESTTGREIIVAVSGTVVVKVSDEGGAIAAGDPLTASSTPGVAMKATKAGNIIGHAAAAYNGTGTGSVLAIVASGHGTGDLESQIQALNSRVTKSETDIADLQSKQQNIDLSNLQVQSATVALDMTVYGTLTAAGSLRVGGDAEFNGNTIFNKLVAFMDSTFFNKDVEFQGNTEFNKDAGGYAVIKTGNNRIHVQFDKEFSSRPPVKVTLANGKFAKYSYENLTTTGFDIVVQAPTPEDLTFSWIALPTSGTQTFVNASMAP